MKRVNSIGCSIVAIASVAGLTFLLVTQPAVRFAAAVGVVGGLAIVVLREFGLRTKMRAFRARHGAEGRDLLIVYSASPHWQEYTSNRTGCRAGAIGPFSSIGRNRTGSRGRRQSSGGASRVRSNTRLRRSSFHGEADRRLFGSSVRSVITSTVTRPRCARRSRNWRTGWRSHGSDNEYEETNAAGRLRGQALSSRSHAPIAVSK